MTTSAYAISVLNDEIFVVDYFGHHVKVFSYDGRLKRTFGGIGIGAGRMACPCGIIASGEHVYVAERGGHSQTCSRVQVFTLQGEGVSVLPLRVPDNGSEGKTGLRCTKGLSLSGDRLLMVVEPCNTVVEKASKVSEVLLLEGMPK